jgi:uncharacterized membrane protein YphA (DoxX/SURF4 family)
MNAFITKAKSWIDSHPNVPLAVVRIYVGLGLLIKGIFFMRHREVLDTLLQSAALPALPVSAGGYVIGAHIVGGLLLTAGLLTRVAALFQLPIFYCAIAYAHVGRMTTLEAREGFEFSGLMLFLCGLLVAFGGGPWSLDARLFRRSERNSWVQSHPDAFLDLVRVFLGVALFVKGVFFMLHRDQLVDLIQQSGTWSIFPMAIAHYVIPVHLAGGIMLALGVLTRVAALFQLPVLFMALFYVHLPRILAIEGRQNMEFTALVLALTMLLVAYGSGRWSIERRLATTTPPSTDGLETKPVTH